VVAGKRRLLACKKLGWKNIPVTIIDIAKIVRGEHAENVQLKDFTLTEAVAIMGEIEPEEKAAAKERMRRGGPGKTGGKLPPLSKGKSHDKAAKATGRKARTLAKAAAIVAAAEADPKKFGKLAEDMDRTGRVMGPITAASPSIMKLRALRRTAPENKSNAVQLRRRRAFDNGAYRSRLGTGTAVRCGSGQGNAALFGSRHQ
jgi:hypothetical protein